MNNDSMYVIVLKNEAREKKQPVANTPQYSSGQMGAQVAVKALVAYNKFGAPFVDQIVQRNVGTIALRTGASELQERTEFALGIAKSTGGLLTSILTGYAIGNAPGAIVGALVSLGTTAFGYINKIQALQHEQNLENISLRGLNERAGEYPPTSIGSRSRTQ